MRRTLAAVKTLIRANEQNATLAFSASQSKETRHAWRASATV